MNRIDRNHFSLHQPRRGFRQTQQQKRLTSIMKVAQHVRCSDQIAFFVDKEGISVKYIVIAARRSRFVQLVDDRTHRKRQSPTLCPRDLAGPGPPDLLSGCAYFRRPSAKRPVTGKRPSIPDGTSSLSPHPQIILNISRAIEPTALYGHLPCRTPTLMHAFLFARRRGHPPVLIYDVLNLFTGGAQCPIFRFAMAVQRLGSRSFPAMVSARK